MPEKQITRVSHLSDFMKGLAKDEVLVPHIYRFLSEGHTIKWDAELAPKGEDNYFHPSGDTRLCSRLLYYKVHPDYKDALIPKVIGSELQSLFDLGNVIHDWVQAVLLEMENFPNYPYLEEAEVPIGSDEFWVRGHGDGSLRLLNGELVLLEIKTVSGWKFSSMKAPADYYLDQTNCYMYLNDFKKCVLLLVNRETGQFREFVYTLDEERAEEILFRFRDVKTAVDSGLPAESLLVPQTTECSSCPARMFCSLGVGVN